MMRNHLYSKDIQRFLDHDISKSEKKQMVNHLYVCNRCRLALEDYKSLYRALETEEGFEVSNDFALNIVSRLDPYQSLPKREIWNDFIFALAGIIISLIASIYYLGAERIQTYITNFQQLFNKTNLIPPPIASSYLKILINPYFFAFVGIIAVILILDRVVLNKRLLHFV